MDRARFRAEVLVPGTGRYRGRSFALERDAKAWAMGEAARVVVGMPSIVSGPRRCRTADMAADYLKGLTARGRSPSHVKNVSRTIAALGAVAPDLLAVGAGALIERWINGATAANLNNVGAKRAGKLPSATSRNRMLVEVRAFVHWLQRRDYLDKDPTRMIERATRGDSLKAQFGLGELAHLLALPTPDPAYWRRFALLTYAGLRSDEAASLTWVDVDLAGGCILVRVHVGHRLKRGRERIVPPQPELAWVIGRAGAPGDLVAPVDARIDSRRFARFIARCGIPAAGRTPHSCRHTYAGLMTATGVPGALLGAYLGHSSADTTAIYTKLAGRYAQAVGAWRRGVFRLR